MTALAEEFGLRRRQTNTQLQTLLEEVARLRGQVATQIEIIEDLEQQATHDALTGILNRYGFETALKDALAYSFRYNRRGVLLMIDLNDFKKVNDTYGHAAGDAMLQQVSAILKKHTRTSDVVARLGGDEFCVILREAGAEEALLKKAELEAMIAGTTCMYEGVELSISASVGACAFQEADNIADLLSKADVAMYQQKAVKIKAGKAS